MKKVESKKAKDLEERIAELTAGWQRTQADFVNFKKQAADERIKLIQGAGADIIDQLLPVLDHFQLAAKHLPKELDTDNWAQGIKQIEKQFENILFENGLERIDSIGQEFSPELHEAIEEVDSDQASGIIVEEILSGYKFAGGILRPAKVKVAK
ncbi:MAG: nucleotide exchange factor GrpE [Candidatus Berkelbacteria bacterium]